MRDYKEYPLQKREIIPKEDLYELYMVKNYSRTRCAEYFNISESKVRHTIRKYGFIKSKEMARQAFVLTNIERYETTHPRKNVEKQKEINEKTKQTCQERYGYDSVGKVPEFKEKQRQTCIEKYGTTQFMSLPHIQEKQRQTCIERYGVDNYSKTQESKDKHFRTNMNKYGVACYLNTKECKEQTRQKCLERYGTEYASQSDEVKTKVKQTCTERYGVNSYMCTEEFKNRSKQEMLKKYGVENYSYAKDFNDKVRATCQEKYGVDYASQSKEFRDKVAQTNLERYGTTCNLASEEGIKKKTETWLKNLGVDHPSKCSEVVKKQWDSKKKNGTAATSKAEKSIKAKLLKKFPNLKTNYNKDVRYPFHCDFYIPEMDLFIEYQGFEGHGNHPFDANNQDDLDLVCLWAERAKKKNLDKRNKYLAYIFTWTERDVLKRETAKKNRLNWLEFFNEKDFDEWFAQV